MTWNKNRTRSCPYCVATMLGLERAKRIVKSDGTTWKSKALAKEIYLARCALNLQFFDGWVELQRHCP